MSIPKDDELLRGEALDPDRPARMELVGADPDLGAETVLEAVGEAGRGIDHDRAGIDLAQEALCTTQVLGDDGVGVL